MERFDQAMGVLDRAYCAAEGAGDWSDVLGELADALGYQQASVEFHDVRVGGLQHIETARIDPADMREYGQHYAHDNPRVNHMRTTRLAVACDHMFLSERDMDRDPFYMDFLAPRNLRYFVSSHSEVFDDGVRGVLALQRDGRDRQADEAGLRAITLLRPHLNRALRMTWGRLAAAQPAEHLERILKTYGLTDAEAHLAQALAYSDSLRGYAARRGLSMNTVYTHYRRVKDKLDCRDRSALAVRLATLAGGGGRDFE